MTQLRPRAILLTSIVTVFGLALSACGDPCLDDGPSIGECKTPAASGSESASATSESESASASASDSAEAGTMSGSSTDTDPTDTDTASTDTDSASTDTDTSDTDTSDTDTSDTASTDTASTDTEDDPCNNGMQDPGETDVDCGGDCVEVNPDNPNDVEGQCGEGEACFELVDCVAGECLDDTCNVCPDDQNPFDPMELGYNSCQSCLLSNCCAEVLDCFANIEKCVCWFNCVEHTGATQQCMDECGNGNIGAINSCMNNSCKADNLSQNCAAP